MTHSRSWAGEDPPADGTQAQPVPESLQGVVAAYAAIRGEGEAAEGLVRVVIDGTGEIVELVIEPDAMGLGSKDLTAAVLDAFRAARAEAHRAAKGISPGDITMPADMKSLLSELSTLAQRNLDGLDRLADSFARLSPDRPR